MSVRALLGRPAESLLLTLGVALAVGATAAGITLAGTTRAQSEALLASPATARSSSPRVHRPRPWSCRHGCEPRPTSG